MAKLKDIDVKNIKIILLNGDKKLREIATAYKVSISAIQSIKTGRTWA